MFIANPIDINGNLRCWGNNSTSSLNTYGGLYEWDEVMDWTNPDDKLVGTTQGLCPIGWHIPTNCEWMNLEYSVGVRGIEVETNNFVEYDRGNNIISKLEVGGSSGFEAIIGTPIRHTANGYYYNNGGIIYTTSLPMTLFWTASSHSIYGGRVIRGLTRQYDGISRGTLTKSYGLSVRCIKDW